MTQAQPRNMIVGLDVDGRSDDALRAALAMSERLGARLRLVHAVEIPAIEDVAGPPAELAETYAKIEADMTERMQAHAAKVAGDPARVKDTVEVLIGNAARTLIERAQETGADWVFLGPHEHTTFFDFGSTARAVLAKARGGVWVQPGAWQPIRRIVTPVDLSDDSMRALHTACTLARKLKAYLTVLHCFQDPEFAYIATPGYAGPAPLYSLDAACEAAEQGFQAAMAEFDWSGVQHEQRFVRGRTIDVVLDSQAGHDLIVMGSHGRTGLSAAVLGNVAYSVLKKASIPVLALKSGVQ